MSTTRLEAFSDGVLAIIITIIVLELKAPESPDWSSLHELVPVFLSYLLSFVFIGIYWNNHHHLTIWMGENGHKVTPTVVYAILLNLAGVAYYILSQVIIRAEGRNSAMANAVGSDRKGLISLVIYAVAVPMAYLSTYISYALFVGVALLWLVPDTRLVGATTDGANGD